MANKRRTGPRHLKLTQYIADIGQTPAGFARALGISPVAMHYFIYGDRKPSGAVLAKLHAATGGYLVPDDFYGEGALYG